MKLRIAIWAGVGALVVILWTLYISSTSTPPHGVAWVLACLTCPVVLAGHYRLSFYFVLLVNAGTYAIVGAVVEAVRGRHRRFGRV